MAILKIPKELKKLFSLGIIFLLLTSIPQIGAQEEQKEQIIFQDDFEAYDVGTFPSKGGWELVWDGRGAQYQVITDTSYHSPTKSLQLLGSYGWSSVAQKRFSTDASIIGFEAYVMVEDYPATMTSASVGFWNRNKAEWGKYYAIVEFASDKYIRASSPIEARNLQPYVPGEWYKIRLVLDRSTNTFSVWINDELKASGMKTENAYEINALELSSGWGSNSRIKCYFDDVRVFTMQPQAQPESYHLSVRLDNVVLNNQNLDVSNPTITVAAGSRITGTATFTVENVQPGGWITPVIWVTSWERGSVADGKVRVVARSISTTKQFTVTIDVTAPTTPGTYYIGFFAGWMYSPDEVASNDHPPRYGDGDDVWDMSQSDWESVVRYGRAPEGAFYPMPGRAVRVVVQGARKLVIPRGGMSNVVSWKYLYDEYPSIGWNKNLTFDDSGWHIGRTPFGNCLFRRTNLYFRDLYLRKVFVVDAIPRAAILSIASDDGVEVWVNGKKILNDISGAHSANYWNYRLDVTPYLKLGENLLAIHVRNLGGNAYFDCALVLESKSLEEIVLDFVIGRFNPDIGFSDDYMDATFYATSILKALESIDILEKDKLIEWILSQRSIHGDFGGWQYYALKSLSNLGFELDAESKENLIESILSRKCEDGSWCTLQVTYEALEELSLLNALNRVQDWSKTVEFICSLQAADGGFKNYIDEPRSYLEYTYYAIRSLYILNSIDKINKNKVLEFIISCYKNGAFSNRPEEAERVDATFWGVKSLEILNSLEKIDSSRVVDRIVSWLGDKGSFGYLGWDYYAVMTLQTLGKLNKLNKAKLISNVMLHENPISGAFKSEWGTPCIVACALTTPCTAAWALRILVNLKMLDRIDVEKVKQLILNYGFDVRYYQFMEDMHCVVYSLKILNALHYVDDRKILDELLKHQSDDGGFKVYETCGEPDIWSTYLAVDTLSMLNMISAVDKTKIVNYVLSLKNPDGSFRFSKNAEWCEVATPLAVETLILLGESRLVDEKTIDFILRSQRDDGGFGDIFNTYLSLKVLDYFKRLDKNVLTKAIRYVLSLQNLDGGFRWREGEMQSSLSSTDYGVSILKQFAADFASVLVPTLIEEYPVVRVDVKPRVSAVRIDGVHYTRERLPLTFESEGGTSHTFQVASDARVADYGNGTRRVFVGWYEDGKLISSEPSLTLVVNRSMNLEARWETQYFITASTPYSSVMGEGWYSEGSFAVLELQDREVGGPLVRYVFDRWEGLEPEDRVLGPGIVSVYVDGPRVLRAVWRVDYSRVYALAFILFAGAVAAGFLVYSRRRRSAPAAATVAVAARTPPSGEGAQPPVEKAAAIAEAPLDPLRAELREYENYLRRLESLRAEGKVSERVYQALKKEYEARIEELKKKLGIPDTK